MYSLDEDTLEEIEMIVTKCTDNIIMQTGEVNMHTEYEGGFASFTCSQIWSGIIDNIKDELEGWGHPAQVIMWSITPTSNRRVSVIIRFKSTLEYRFNKKIKELENDIRDLYNR